MRIINGLFKAAGQKENIETLANLGIRDSSGKVPPLNRQFREWTKRMVDNVVFHTINKSYTLSEIDGLIIDSRKEQAWIKVGNKKLELQSETPEGEKIPMKVKSLLNIHLNRTRRMVDLLNDLSRILPTMENLTLLIRETIKGETRERKSRNGMVTVELDKYQSGTLDLISQVFAEKVKFEDVVVLLPLLLVELNYIGAATELAAISDKLNLVAKKNNIVSL